MLQGDICRRPIAVIPECEDHIGRRLKQIFPRSTSAVDNHCRNRVVLISVNEVQAFTNLSTGIVRDNGDRHIFITHFRAHRQISSQPFLNEKTQRTFAALPPRRILGKGTSAVWARANHETCLGHARRPESLTASSGQRVRTYMQLGERRSDRLSGMASRHQNRRPFAVPRAVQIVGVGVLVVVALVVVVAAFNRNNHVPANAGKTLPIRRLQLRRLRPSLHSSETHTRRAPGRHPQRTGSPLLFRKTNIGRKITLGAEGPATQAP
jgi:hypothetical protein